MTTRDMEQAYMEIQLKIADLVLYRTVNANWFFEEELILIDLEIDALENLAEVQLAKLAFYAQEEGMFDADNIEVDEEYEDISKKDFIKLLLDNAAEDIKEREVFQKDVDAFISDIYETLQTENRLSDAEKDELFEMFLESLEEENEEEYPMFDEEEFVNEKFFNNKDKINYFNFLIELSAKKARDFSHEMN